MIRVRIKATGQVLDMVPANARAMILGGTAIEIDREGKPVEAKTESQVETAAIDLDAERADAPAQHPQKKKAKK